MRNILSAERANEKKKEAAPVSGVSSQR
jgi:hypothetical protein